VGMAPSAIRVEGPEASTRSRCSLSNNCSLLKFKERAGTEPAFAFYLRSREKSWVKLGIPLGGNWMVRLSRQINLYCWRFVLVV
jgi:hypothetical protein